MTAPVAETKDSNPLALLSLSERFSVRTRKVLAAYFVAQTAFRVGKKWWDKAKERGTFTVAVLGGDQIYPDVHRWLLDRIPEERRRAITAQSRRQGGYIVEPEGGRDESPALNLFYDGSRTQVVELDGHRVSVSLERPEWQRDWGEERPSWQRDRERIVFTATSVAGRGAVVAFLTEISDAQDKRLPRIYSVNRWSDGWTRHDDLPQRGLDTVVLRAGAQEALVEDLEHFLAEEHDYADLGTPYHRGYLLHGPPGGGKTSVARALASHFGLDVYFIPLTAVKDDSILNALFSQVSSRSMLLLEDIDVVHAAQQGDTETTGVTLLGLLNTLDGFATPHGLIMVMTTNRVEVLDERLIRAGRVDYRIEVPHLDDEQLGRLTRLFMKGDHPPLPPIDHDIAPADVVGIFKRHLRDRDAAFDALLDLLNGRPS